MVADHTHVSRYLGVASVDAIADTSVPAFLDHLFTKIDEHIGK